MRAMPSLLVRSARAAKVSRQFVRYCIGGSPIMSVKRSASALARQRDLTREFVDCPAARRISMQQGQRVTDIGIMQPGQPALQVGPL
jgi:hypothetical protein